MAAFDTPWMTSMAPPTAVYGPSSPSSSSAPLANDPNPPTTAAFAPSQAATSRRRTVLVHQQSALLIATPPQVTRALAFSHPFLLPLSKLVGLISWSSGDPWESFLLVASFWALVLFGADVIKWSGPVLVVAALVGGMWGRRYSPLSTHAVLTDKERGKSGSQSSQRGTSNVGRGNGGMRHQKSLDEIVETLNEFTARCNILLDPLLELTDFLSTQQTATSATTRPALTTLFIRLLMTLPLWVGLTMPPLRLLTAQRVVLVAGTLFLTWHARPARIARTVLWRSLTVRQTMALVTGLSFSSAGSSLGASSILGRRSSQHLTASSLASSRQSSKTGGGVRFTFSVYENQRRWLGLGWTSVLFAYERAAWTDEHLNATPPKERFPLPVVEGGGAAWRWVPGSEWCTEGGQPGKGGDKAKNAGWVYYDNKWQDPRAADGWGRYTRRRKWFRDAELVDVEPGTDTDTEKETETAGSIRSRRSTADSAASGAPSESSAPRALDTSQATARPHPSAAGTSSTLLSPITASASTGIDAVDFATDGKGDDAASILSTASAQSTSSAVKRRGFFRRSRSYDDRGSVGSEKKPAAAGSRKDSTEDEDARSANNGSSRDEDTGSWLMGDEVKMGLG